MGFGLGLGCHLLLGLGVQLRRLGLLSPQLVPHLRRDPHVGSLALQRLRRAGAGPLQVLEVMRHLREARGACACACACACTMHVRVHVRGACSACSTPREASHHAARRTAHKTARCNAWSDAPPGRYSPARHLGCAHELSAAEDGPSAPERCLCATRHVRDMHMTCACTCTCHVCTYPRVVSGLREMPRVGRETQAVTHGVIKRVRHSLVGVRVATRGTA